MGTNNSVLASFSVTEAVTPGSVSISNPLVSLPRFRSIPFPRLAALAILSPRYGFHIIICDDIPMVSNWRPTSLSRMLAIAVLASMASLLMKRIFCGLSANCATVLPCRTVT